MNDDTSILGCYVSVTLAALTASQDVQTLASQQGRLFRTYISGDNGIDKTLKKLKHQDYGNDLILILLRFYVNPLPVVIEKLEEIENYKKKERAIGIPIIINQVNFFNKSEEERYSFLKEEILRKINILEDVVKKKKLDTNVKTLKEDLIRIFNVH